MKQILTARQLANLKKRLAIAMQIKIDLGLCDPNYDYGIDQYPLHPLSDQKTKRLPAVTLMIGGEDQLYSLSLLSSSNCSSNTIRKFLISTLPGWPTVNCLPAFDGFMTEGSEHAVGDTCWWKVLSSAESAHA